MSDILSNLGWCWILIAILGFLLGYFLAKDNCNKEESLEVSH